TSIANSLVSIEYFDNANNIQRLGSSAYDADEVASTLTVESSTPFRARLQVSYFDVDIGFEVVLRLDGARLRIEIPDSSLTGEELYRLASINMAAFFGASGGRQVFWNPTTEDYDLGRP